MHRVPEVNSLLRQVFRARRRREFIHVNSPSIAVCDNRNSIYHFNHTGMLAGVFIIADDQVRRMSCYLSFCDWRQAQSEKHDDTRNDC